jgi:ankyrin repeat protein
MSDCRTHNSLVPIQGSSVLHIAVVYGNKAMARLLLDHGANVNVDSGEVSGTSITACLFLIQPV